MVCVLVVVAVLCFVGSLRNGVVVSCGWKSCLWVCFLACARFIFGTLMIERCLDG